MKKKKKTRTDDYISNRKKINKKYQLRSTKTVYRTSIIVSRVFRQGTWHTKTRYVNIVLVEPERYFYRRHGVPGFGLKKKNIEKNSQINFQTYHRSDTVQINYSQTICMYEIDRY